MGWNSRLNWKVIIESMTKLNEGVKNVYGLSFKYTCQCVRGAPILGSSVQLPPTLYDNLFWCHLNFLGRAFFQVNAWQWWSSSVGMAANSSLPFLFFFSLLPLGFHAWFLFYQRIGLLFPLISIIVSRC